MKRLDPAHLARLTDLAVALAATAMVALHLPWDLILSPSTPTGGDSCTHYASFVHFHQQILPQWRLWGWYQGGLAGFPMFQFYFPLPFLGMSLLALPLGLPAAFKLGSILPALAFPACVWLCARGLGFPRPGPAAAVALGLAFLFQESNHVWGGNIAAMLAGEFAQAWAICLGLVYLSRLPDWMRHGRGLAGCALLLWLMGLCHAYIMLLALLAGLFFPLSQRPWTRAAWRLLVLYGIAFLLLAHWSIPMLAYSPYTEDFNLIWILDSWTEYFPRALLPAIALAPLGLVLAARSGQPHLGANAAYILGWLLITALLYLAAPHMNTVTVRFAPMGYLALVLLAALGVGLALARLKAANALALLLLVGGMVWSGQGVNSLHDWLGWNFAGAEAKELWPHFARMKDFLAGDYAQPRISYEHTLLHQRLGSARSMEALPLWTGRATLESAYLQASLSSPFVFYLQSETCQASSTPLSQYAYSRFNLPRAIEHMILFNAGQYLALDQNSRQQADQQPGLTVQARFGPYAVYQVDGNSGRYLEPPRHWPVLVRTNRPQHLAHLWYRQTDLAVPLVFVKEVTPQDRDRFPQVRLDSGAADDPLLEEIVRDRLPRLSLDAPRPRAEEIGHESLVASGVRPGLPLLVKFSYHPAWRADGGEKVYRVTPAFMLVFPQGDEVRLAFGWSWPHHLGLAMTLLGLFCLGAAWRRPAWARRLIDLGRPPGEWSAMTRRGWWVVAAALTALAALLVHLHDDAATLRLRASRLADEGRLEEARRVYRQGLARHPLSMSSDYTLFDLAMTHFREGEHQRALELLRQLLRDQPDSALLPETLHHLALCLEALGQAQEGRATRAELLVRFPHSRWAALNREDGTRAGATP